jgi:hypothetical protein
MCLYCKKKSSPEPAILIKLLGTNYSLVKGIKNCLYKGPGPLQRGDYHKNGMGSFKDFPLKNHCVRKAQIYMKAKSSEIM